MHARKDMHLMQSRVPQNVPLRARGVALGFNLVQLKSILPLKKHAKTNFGSVNQAYAGDL